MYRRFLPLLMLLILGQSTLAAADAHVLHEVSGESSHQHFYNDQSPDLSIANKLRYFTDLPPTDGDLSDEQSCQHHCCHGHNIKYFNEPLALCRDASNLTVGWGYQSHYLPPTVAPEFRPPIA